MNKNSKLMGAMYGAVAAACYGMNPLFALPLYSAHVGVNSVLFYRYALATVILGIWLKFFKKVHLRITRQEFFPLFTMGLIFSFSSYTLFKSYTYMDAGIASTILFIYPILVALIMVMFFKEKLRFMTVISILLTSIGIALLYNGKDGQTLNLFGVLLVFLSALSYAIYITGVKNIPTLAKMNSDKMIFYVMLFGIIIYVYNLDFFADLQIIHSPVLWLYASALALLPTVISLAAMTSSIKIIGATPAAILGALEPVTAIFFGVVVFHEQLTVKICVGILTILLAVLIIILKKDSKVAVESVSSEEDFPVEN